MSVHSLSDKHEAEKTRYIVERTRDKVEIVVRLPYLNDARRNTLLRDTVNITDDEIALLARIYSDLEPGEIKNHRASRSAPTTVIVSQEMQEESAEVSKANSVLVSNTELWKLLRENRTEISPNALAFVNCPGKYQHRSEMPAISQQSRDEQDQEAFAGSNSTAPIKADINLSSGVAKKKRTIRRYAPSVDKLVGGKEKQPPAKASDESNIELLEFASREQNSALRARELQVELEKLIRKHLLEEKKLRQERDKAEDELVACLEEYDRDIGSLQARLEHETVQFEEEQRQMIVLEENFRVQEILYEQLMAEKLAEYQRELKEKMYLFVCNRAALRIQRYWRAFRERKLAKKKRKGRKGKAGSGGKSTKN